MTHPPDNRLRLRLFIDSRLADEVWLNADDPHAPAKAERTALAHTAAADQADADGQPWMTEVYDPAADPDRAYLRIGTDTSLMEDPQALGPDSLGRLLDYEAGPTP